MKSKSPNLTRVLFLTPFLRLDIMSSLLQRDHAAEYYRGKKHQNVKNYQNTAQNC